LPTGVEGGEWEVEVDSWHTDSGHGSTTPLHAFKSTLKLSKAGFRRFADGNISRAGSAYDYSSASADPESDDKRFGMYFRDDFTTGPQTSREDSRGFGFSVRCIKN
jgi:hypothetical protein